MPYADFNLLKFPQKDAAMEKIADLTLLSDIFPTGFHGAVKAGVKPGSIVYVAGAGPVGLASSGFARLIDPSEGVERLGRVDVQAPGPSRRCPEAFAVELDDAHRVGRRTCSVPSCKGT